MMRIKFSQSIVLEKILLLELIVFLFYMLWYQYAVSEVSGFLAISGIMLSLTTILKTINDYTINYYKSLGIVFFFSLFALISGFFTTHYFENYYSSTLLVFEYLLPMIAVVCFIGYKRSNLQKIMSVIALISVVLSFSVLISDTITGTSAITLGTYNTNLLSSILVFGLISIMYVFCDKETYILKLLFVVLLGINVYSQVECASRRGVLVTMMLIIGYIYSWIQIKQKSKVLLKIITVIASICIAVVFALYVLPNIDDLVIIKRFLGDANTESGDNARYYYIMVALGQFLDSPICGNGLGAVAGKIGLYSHSMYTELLACTGIIGFISIVLFLLNITYGFFKITNNLHCNSTVIFKNKILMYFAISILVSGIAVVYIYDATFYIMLSVLVAAKNINNMHGVKSS